MKYYLFQDKLSDSSFAADDDKYIYYAPIGLVLDIVSPLGKPCVSMKDMVVSFIHPFNGSIERQWRSFGEVFLTEVPAWHHAMITETYQLIEEAIK